MPTRQEDEEKKRRELENRKASQEKELKLLRPKVSKQLDSGTSHRQASGPSVQPQLQTFPEFVEQKELRQSQQQTAFETNRRLDAEKAVSQTPGAERLSPQEYESAVGVALEEQTTIAREREEARKPVEAEGFVEAGGQRQTVGARTEPDAPPDMSIRGQLIQKARPIDSAEVIQDEALKRDIVTSTSTEKEIRQIAANIQSGKMVQKEGGEVTTQELGNITITTPVQLSLVKQMQSGDSRVRKRARELWEERGYGAIPTSQVFGASTTKLGSDREALASLTPRERSIRKEERKGIERELRNVRQIKAKEERDAIKAEQRGDREDVREARRKKLSLDKINTQIRREQFEQRKKEFASTEEERAYQKEQNKLDRDERRLDREQRTLDREQRVGELEATKKTRELRNVLTLIDIANKLDPAGAPKTQRQIDDQKIVEQKKAVNDRFLDGGSLQDASTEDLDAATEGLDLTPEQKLTVDNKIRTDKFQSPHDIAREEYERVVGGTIPDVVPMTSNDIESKRVDVAEQLADGKTTSEIVEKAVRDEEDPEKKAKAGVSAAMVATEESNNAYEAVRQEVAPRVEANNARANATATSDMQTKVDSGDSFNGIVTETLDFSKDIRVLKDQYGTSSAGVAEFAQDFPNYVSINNMISDLGENPSQAEVDNVLAVWMVSRHSSDPAVAEIIADNFKMIREGRELEVTARSPEFMELRNILYKDFGKKVGEAILKKENTIKSNSEKGFLTSWKLDNPYEIDTLYANDSIGRQGFDARKTMNPIQRTVADKLETKRITEIGEKVQYSDQIIYSVKNYGTIPVYVPRVFSVETSGGNVEEIIRFQNEAITPSSEKEWESTIKGVKDQFARHPDQGAPAIKVIDNARNEWQGEKAGRLLGVSKDVAIKLLGLSPIIMVPRAVSQVRRMFDDYADEYNKTAAGQANPVTSESFPAEQALRDPEALADELEAKTTAAVEGRRAEAEKLKAEGWQPGRLPDGSIVLTRTDADGKVETQPWSK